MSKLIPVAAHTRRSPQKTEAYRAVHADLLLNKLFLEQHEALGQVVDQLIAEYFALVADEEFQCTAGLVLP